MKVNYHILDKTIIINYNSKVIKVNRNSELGDKVISLIKNDKLNDIPDIIDVEFFIKKHSNEKFYVNDGVVYSYGEPVHNIIATKIMQFHNNLLPFDNLLNFWNNIKENPSESSKKELYSFLECNEFPLTPDGHFIAYKRVASNFRDIYSGKYDNSIGSIVEMDRAEVDDNRNNVCSTGLHIASFDYAKNHYGSANKDEIILEVKVNPKDIVSIPTDYNNAKARCCRYEVIGVVEKEHDELLLTDEKYNNDLEVTVYNENELEDILDDIQTDNDIDHQTKLAPRVKVGNYYLHKFEISEHEFKNLTTGLKSRKPSRIPNNLATIHTNNIGYLYAIKLYVIGRSYYGSYNTDNSSNLTYYYKFC